MAGRRNNNEGTFTKRADGRWEARLSLPNGKRKCFYGKTQKEVKEKLREAQRDIDAGLPLVAEKQLFGDFIESWLASKRYLVDGSSWILYESKSRCHILPTLKSVPVARLTPQHIQKLYAKLFENGKSVSTVRYVHVILNMILKEALRLGLVQKNIMDFIQRPKKADHEMKTWSEQQVRTFLENRKEDRFYALYVLALTLGVREGELLALQWQDIDFDKGILVVRQGLQKSIKGGYILAEPKSKSSKRRLTLSKKAIDALRLHRLRQMEERMQVGSAWHLEHNFVFPNSVGDFIKPTNFGDYIFHKSVKGLDLPKIRFHDLRHTAATLLLGRGMNVKVVSEMLGHSDVAITLRVYAHVIPDMQQATADVMDVVLSV